MSFAWSSSTSSMANDVGARLNGVEDVEAKVNHITDDRLDIPARVVKGYKSMALSQVVPLPLSL